MDKIQWITRADDAGGCTSANRAIFEAVEAGTIRNVSVMACGVALDEAALLFGKRTDICLGLHVTLNAEWERVKWGPVLPVAEVPTLLEPGTDYFTTAPQVLNERGFSVEEAVAEVAAQLARARESGLTITYLDEHMGVGWIRSVDYSLRDALHDFCRREGLIDAIDLRPAALPRPETPATGTDPVENMVDRWLDVLETVPSGVYLTVTHPGRVAPDMELFAPTGEPLGVVATERDIERRALTSPRLREGLEHLGISPVRYDAL